MSELYGTAYRDRAEPQAISATKLLGQVMFLSKDLAPWMWPLIFVSIVNIFLSLLNIFSGR
jgi:hypothetical protein